MKTKTLFLAFFSLVLLSFFLIQYGCKKVEESKQNESPTAAFTNSPISGVIYTNIQFDGSDSYDNEDPISQLQVRWDFDGDGNWDTGWDTSKTVGQQYSIENTYSVRMEVKDTEGLTNYIMHGITVGYNGGGNGCEGVTTVNYGDQIYNTVEIGNQCWLKENLNIGTRINSSEDMSDNEIIEKYCQDDKETNCEKYGGLYNWDEMVKYTTTQVTQGICPDGWHLPRDEAWIMLSDFLGGSNVAGGKMKEIGIEHWNSPNTGATNSSNFTGLPGGYCFYSGGSFYHFGNKGYWWSSSESSNSYVLGCRLSCSDDDLYHTDYYKAHSFSVRCLKD